MARGKPGDRRFVAGGDIDADALAKRAKRRREAEPPWREKLFRAYSGSVGVVLLGADVRAIVDEWDAMCEVLNEQRARKP